MAALHPFFVHFPIALFLTASLFDLVGTSRKWASATYMAFSIQILAAISSLLAAFSGNLAESTIMGQQELTEGIAPALQNHVSWGSAMIWVIIVFVLARTFAVLEKKAWAFEGWMFPLASLALSALVIYTGLLGGELSQSILDYFVLN